MFICFGRCVRATKKDATPFTMIGDGKYHNYTIDWHTGDASKAGVAGMGRVEFWIDGVYMGTNNAFVPTRASRFYIAHWFSANNKNKLWCAPSHLSHSTPNTMIERGMILLFSDFYD